MFLDRLLEIIILGGRTRRHVCVCVFQFFNAHSFGGEKVHMHALL